MNVVVLPHIACEPPGAFEDMLVERGANIIGVELDEHEALPGSLDGIDAIVVMGGPMSVNDEAQHPGWPSRKRSCAAPYAPGCRSEEAAWASSCSHPRLNLAPPTAGAAEARLEPVVGMEREA